jgi:predicted NBD/HSP70 family sugar kinase
MTTDLHLLPPRAGELLRTVHRGPGITRSQAAAELGISTGAASDLVARLVDERWLSEAPAPPAGGRGRPTRPLWPHPEGPVVAVAAIAHETWEVEAVALGGTPVWKAGARHDRDCRSVLEAVADGWRELQSALPGRVRGFAVSVPGTVSGTQLVQAPNLGWGAVDLAVLRPPDAGAARFTPGNDASLSALAEFTRGVAAGTEGSLHLFMDSGIGGALVERGRVTAGAHGMAGEFGHMPFGSRRVRCRCGARGCWNTELDGAALARSLGAPEPEPADEVSYSRSVLTAARAGRRAEQSAAGRAAAALGRGAAGLVNATDPELVVLSGLAAELLAAAPKRVWGAYREGLMQTLAGAPPELVPGTLGARGPLIGAAESAFAALLASSTADGPASPSA